MSASLANRMKPEEVLEAAFSQAFAGGAFRLPTGVTRADLRAALALKPSVQLYIYEQIRLRFTKQTPVDARPVARNAGKWAWFAGSVVAITVVCLAAGLPLLEASKVRNSVAEAPVKRSPPPALHQFAREAAPVSQSQAEPGPQVEPVVLLLKQAMQDTAAFETLQNRAATGDASAAYALALLLDSQRTQNEITVPKDDKAAFALYEQAAQAGNTEAEFATGQAYQTGHGVTPDAALATAWYRAAALNGLAAAQTSLGFAYQTGLGIPQDDASASFWFSRAAAQADPAGETALGYLYLFGQGLAQDQPHAVALFSKAAAQNFGPAFLALGYCYAQGLGTAPDTTRAARYFYKAGLSGVPQAGAALAMLVRAPVQEQTVASLAMQNLGN